MRGACFADIQFARADFIVRAIRERLPPSSLYHDKLGSLSQVENLVISSTGGMYGVIIHDATKLQALRPDILVCGSLKILVVHVYGTHRQLRDLDLAEIVEAANRDFDVLLTRNQDAVTSVFRRVTCGIHFRAAHQNLNLQGQGLLERLGEILQWPLTYVPYVAHELWLPSPENFGLEEDRTSDIERAGEFIFDTPLSAAEFSARLQAAAMSGRPRAIRGIRGRVPSIPEIQSLNLVGRYF